jgi:hypothetical protein
LSYGALPNSHLLLFYGFTVDNNPYDEVHIALAPNNKSGDQTAGVASAQEEEEEEEEGEGVSVLRGELLSTAGLNPSYQHAVRGWGNLPPALIATARLMTASAAELRDMKQHVDAAAAAVTADRRASSTSKKAGGKKKGSNKGKAAATAGVQESMQRSYVLQRLSAGALSDVSEAAALRLILRALDDCRIAESCGQSAEDAAGSISAVAASQGQTGKSVGYEEGEAADGSEAAGSIAAAFGAAVQTYVRGQHRVTQWVRTLITQLRSAHLHQDGA